MNLRAPLVLRHHPTVLVAVLAAAVLVGLAGASSPLGTTAVASEAFENEIDDLTPLSTGLELGSLQWSARPESAAKLAERATLRDRAVSELAEQLGSVGQPVVTTVVPERDRGINASSPHGFTRVRLMARTDALAHVTILSRTDGDGVWISHTVANELGVRAGGRLILQTDREVSLRVKGIYRALAHETERPYWVNFYSEIYSPDPDIPPPPNFVFTSRPELFRAVARLGGERIQHVYELPIAPGKLTLERARALDERFAAIGRDLERRRSPLARTLACSQPTDFYGPGQPPARCTASSSLSAAVTLADASVSAVSPAVTLLSALGAGIALAVAAATGVFAVRRRRVEAALRFARGEHVGAFAGRTALEALLPTLVGATAGFALAVGVTDTFASRGAVDAGTFRSAAWHAALAAAVGLVLLTLTAALAFVRLYDTGVRQRAWLRHLPWELPLLAVGGYLLATIASGSGLASSGSADTQHPTLAVFLCPLLLVAGASGLGARLARWLLGRGSGRRVRALPVSLYLAVRRLAAARGLLVVLATLCAVAFGGLVYSEALAKSLAETADQKAYIAHGSDVEAIVTEGEVVPKDFPYPLTRVQYDNDAGSVNTSTGPQVDIVLVDPETLLETLHWQRSWGSDPTELVGQLESAAPVPLPVIVTSSVPAMKQLALHGSPLDVEILGTVRAFPGQTTNPAVITSFDAMRTAARRGGVLDPLEIPRTYLWAKGPPEEVAAALEEAVDAYAVATVDEFRRDPDVLLATRTYSYMRLIALAAGVLAVAGLLLYLQARQRSQAIASALSRRMGFGGGREILSLSVELGAIVLFCGVVGAVVALLAAEPIASRIDPLPQFTPSPVFAIPYGATAVAAAALAAVALAAGALTSWLARRTDVSEVLRVD